MLYTVEAFQVPLLFVVVSRFRSSFREGSVPFTSSNLTSYKYAEPVLVEALPVYLIRHPELVQCVTFGFHW